MQECKCARCRAALTSRQRRFWSNHSGSAAPRDLCRRNTSDGDSIAGWRIVFFEKLAISKAPSSLSSYSEISFESFDFVRNKLRNALSAWKSGKEAASIFVFNFRIKKKSSSPDEWRIDFIAFSIRQKSKTSFHCSLIAIFYTQSRLMAKARTDEFAHCVA